MSKALKDAVKYSGDRISLEYVSLENYVTTDNLLQNKQGKVSVESLPPNSVNVTKYEKGDIDIEWIGTPTKMIMVPKVIRLLYYTKVPHVSMRLTRQNLFERDRHTCQYCGKKFKTEDLTIEHILPRSRGGKN